MHIPPQVSSIYGEMLPVATALKAEVDRFMGRRPQDWHYVSRVKSEESYFQKLETGRVLDPRTMEDFFACSVIIPATHVLDDALAFIERFFEAETRRPQPGKTSKRASDFRFDDLRLYGRLRKSEALPVGPIHEMSFEIQLKTLLTHAWGVATHDVIYKSIKTSWARDRIGYQLRAVLEHVELAIGNVDALEAASRGLPEGIDDDRINRYVDFIKSNWQQDFAPPDLRRSAFSIDELADKFKVKREDLLRAFTDGFDGENLPLGITPVAYAFSVIENNWPEKARDAWRSTRLNGYSWLKTVNAEEAPSQGRSAGSEAPS